MTLFRKVLAITVLASILTSFASADPYQWLEDIEGSKSMEWVGNQNAVTSKNFGASKEYEQYVKDAQKILESKDKISYPISMGKFVYNFWQDSDHVRGIWRRKLQEQFDKNTGSWETVLDIDDLSGKEGKNWVFQGADCLYPEYKLCLLFLSNGGKDASEVREFNVETKTFPVEGFKIPEAKTRASWRDANSIFVATKFDGHPMTNSGYPSAVKILVRNKNLFQGDIIKRTNQRNMSVDAARYFHKSESADVVTERLTFQESNYYKVSSTGRAIKLDLPKSAELIGFYEGHLIFSLQTNSTVNSRSVSQGSVIAVKFNNFGQVNAMLSIFTPEFFGNNFARRAVQNVLITKDKIIMDYTDNLEGKIRAATIAGGSLSTSEVSVGSSGEDVKIRDADLSSDKFYYTTESFDKPTALYSKNFSSPAMSRKIQELPRFFNSNSVKIKKMTTKSADGTEIPYFVVSSKEVKKDSKQKVLLYGYGGFNVSMRPFYNPVMGKNWLEKGGVYVLANIRGGGEFGPGWHLAAIRDKKQKSYDDFIAVAEDLIRSKITSPQKLAIMGGSNGGLLVGAVSMQRPDLFGAVVCMVPLLDMKRYNKLLAGASWEAEYGNPDGSDWQFIEKYSPYQNAKKDVKYPKFLFYTSTKDDRVHPGHARKMAALLQSLNAKDIYLYENVNGGHSASANLKERAKQWAMIYEFVNKSLGN